MRKRLLIMLLATAVIATGGCGKSSSGEGDAKGKSEIELFSSKSENQEFLQTLVDEYNEGQDQFQVTLNAPADAETVLKTRLAKGDIPDILAFNYSNVTREILQDGFWVDMNEDPLAQYCYDEYKNMIKADNKEDSDALYGLPYAANAGGVIYNVDKFEEAGLDIPQTWDEFIDLAKTLKENGETPFLFPFKDIWTAKHPFVYLEAIMQPDNFESDRKAGKTTYVGTHEEIADRFLTILDYAQDDYMGLSYSDANKAFANGEAYMMINGNWVIPEIKKANPDCNVSMFAMPVSNNPEENKVSTGIDVMFTLSKDCENMDGAKDFIDFMMQKEQAQRYMDDQFALSAVNTATQEDPSVSVLQDYISDGKICMFADMQIPNGMDFDSALSQFCLNYSNGMDRDEAISQFLADVDEKFDTAIAQNQ